MKGSLSRFWAALSFMPKLHGLKYIFLCGFLFGCATTSVKDIARDPFLHPYVQQLKESSSHEALHQIADMDKSELILLLHGYGMGIRNRWIHGNRDPQLVYFFHTKGIDDPEASSMVIIEALWYDLNSDMSPAERAIVKTKRGLVARKRATYEKLERQCERQLVDAKSDFERCYTRYGLPSKNPSSRDPFFELRVGRSGRVSEIIFFEGASPELKAALTKILNGFSFSPFEDDEFVTLYVIEFPSCRVEERDRLHDRI